MGEVLVLVERAVRMQTAECVDDFGKRLTGGWFIVLRGIDKLRMMCQRMNRGKQFIKSLLFLC